MNSAARNRYHVNSSFVVCFYCNETFRSLSSLLKHCCSVEENISMDWEPNESLSNTFDADLSQADWEPHETLSDTNICDIGQENSVCSESVSEKLSDTLRQEATEAESNESNVCENYPPETECGQSLPEMNSNAITQEITDLAPDVPEKQSLEAKADIIRERDPDLSSDISEKHSETNLDVVKAVTDLATDGLEKQLTVADLGTEQKIAEVEPNINDEFTRISPDLVSTVLQYFEKQTKQDPPDSCCKSPSTEIEFQSSHSPLPTVESSSPRQDNTEIVCSDISVQKKDLSSDAKCNTSTEDSTNEDSNIVCSNISICNKGLSSDTKCHADSNRDDSDIVCNSVSIRNEGLSSVSKCDTDSSQDDTNIECADINFCNKGLSTDSMCNTDSSHVDSEIVCNDIIICDEGLPSKTKCNTDGEDMQNELETLKQDARGLESYNSDVCSRSSSPEGYSSGMLSRSSSVGMDLDSFGYGDQAESDDSDICSISSISENKSHEHDHVPAKLPTSKISNKPLLKESLNITKHGSVILKPCYVKVHDIFKTLSSPKLSPKKIFSMRKKYHVCDVCNKFFRMKSDLNIHYLIHTVKKPFVCNICGKSFIKQCNLFTHHLAVHSIIKRHACPVCKKTFLKDSLLLRHKLTHSNEKPFKCDKCNKSYAVKSSLNEHYLNHSNERPFICEICSASFHNKRYLRKHYYRHNRNEVNLCCKICFKTFKRKDHLDEHYNIHGDDKPHKCPICDKSYHLLLTLNRHFAAAHKNERDRIFQKKVQSIVQSMSGKDPIIQKIEKSTIIEEGGKTPVKKIEKSSIDKNKETVPYSTRRKSFTPRKYLQPDSISLY